MAAELKPLADIDGFIDIERFQSLTTEGKILSLSWWRDEEARPLLEAERLSSGGAGQKGRASIFFLPYSRGAADAGIQFETGGHADV